MDQGLPFELIHMSYNYLAKMFWMPTVPGEVLMSTSCGKIGKGYILWTYMEREDPASFIQHLYIYINDLSSKSQH